MSITLGSITLPDGMIWTDEFADSAAEFADARTVTGKLIRQTGIKNGGRSIMLSGGWATRATVISLKALQDAGTTVTLTLHDGRTFSTQFAEAGSLNASPVINYQEPAATDCYELELNLVEVAS